MTTATLDARPAVRPAPAAPGAATNLVRLFALDRLPEQRPRLVCRWHRDADGRLAGAWEPDIAPVRQR